MRSKKASFYRADRKERQLNVIVLIDLGGDRSGEDWSQERREGAWEEVLPQGKVPQSQQRAEGWSRPWEHT